MWLPVLVTRKTQGKTLTMRVRRLWRVDEKRRKTPAKSRRSSGAKMERALRYSAMEMSGMSRADIARAEGVSRARVTQVLRLCA